MAHPVPYYYASGGKYVLFLDLLGFTSFVRSSFQKAADQADSSFRAYRLALGDLKRSQAEVGRLYRRFHAHLETILRRPSRRGKAPSLSVVFSDCAYVVFERGQDAQEMSRSLLKFSGGSVDDYATFSAFPTRPSC